jgi:hypothetical protein
MLAYVDCVLVTGCSIGLLCPVSTDQPNLGDFTLGVLLPGLRLNSMGVLLPGFGLNSKTY